MSKRFNIFLLGFHILGKLHWRKNWKKIGFAHINIDQLKFGKGYTDVGDDDVPDLVWNEILQKQIN